MDMHTVLYIFILYLLIGLWGFLVKLGSFWPVYKPTGALVILKTILLWPYWVFQKDSW